MTEPRVTGLRVDRLSEPLAIDDPHVAFSWRLESDEAGARQVRYRVTVEEAGGARVWDSGVVESSASTDIRIGRGAVGRPVLLPEHAYRWQVLVVDDAGRELVATSRFETAFFDRTVGAWDGAQWIGADRPPLDAASLVVFRVRARIRLGSGATAATLVLGANDFRLRRAVFNEYGLAGPNRVEFTFDVADRERPVFRITRVGYAPGDDSAVPLLEVPAGPDTNLAQLLPSALAFEEHDIELVCWSSAVSVLIDGRELVHAGGTRFAVNPRGTNDVASFPNLAEVGFAARAGERYEVRGYEIRTFRAPEAVLFDHRDLGVFADAPGVVIEGDRLVVSGGAEGVLVHRDPSRDALPVLRRIIDLDAAPDRARLTITARGVYEFEINGERIGEDWFNPGSSDYRRTIEYSTYDVTGSLRPGRNTVLVRLASGWWSDMVSFMRVNTGFYGDRPSLLAKLVLDGPSGREVVVTEPGRWQVRTDGPIRSGSFFQGERYDARLEHRERSEDGWSGAVTVTPLERNARPALVAKPDRPVRVFETRSGTLIGESRPGSDAWIYDMGVNLVGVPEVDLDAGEGRTIVLRTAEMLYPDLEEYRRRDIAGLLMTENLREALSTDFYVTREGRQTIRPRFTYHGYRYLEVTGTGGPLPDAAVRALVLSSIDEISGDVTTSDPEVNQLMANIQRSQIGNFLSIPTDCPQRNERLGWLEAVTEFARTSCFTSDVATFYERFLHLVRDAQVTEELLTTGTDPLGFHEQTTTQSAEDPAHPTTLFTGPVVTGMYPSYVPGYDAYRSWGTPWSSAGVLVPYEVYRHYGGTGVIERSFDSMRTYLEAMEQLRLPGTRALSADGGTCGDWLSLDKPPYTYTDASVYVHTLACFSEMAGAIGRQDVQAEYAAKHAAARAEWNERYIDPSTGRFRDDPSIVNTSQSSCVLALFYDLPEERHRAAILAALVEKVEQGYEGRPHTITTGLFTTPMINLVLSDNGRSDLAYAMLGNREFPSWLYPVTQGATSMWERWNSFTREGGFGGNNAMNSFNHFSLGGVGAWMFNRVVGIDRDPETVGMQHVLLHPVPDRSLTSASGHVTTDFGRIEVDWRWIEDDWAYDVRLPANTSAALELAWVTEAEPAPALVHVDRRTKGVRMELPAGRWSVRVRDGVASVSASAVETVSVGSTVA